MGNSKRTYPELPTGRLPSFLAKQEASDRAETSLQMNTSNPETLEKRISIGREKREIENSDRTAIPYLNNSVNRDVKPMILV